MMVSTHLLKRPFAGALSALALAAALSLTACGGGGDDGPPPTDTNLVSVQVLSTPVGLTAPATTVRKLRYRMPAVRGGTTEAGGMLFVPMGTPPAGGWPLVAWGHGTTGVADACAPSNDYATLGDPAAVSALLTAGFAVVAPDYEGLGGVGVHPYYSRSSHAAALTQAVKAAWAVPGVSLSRRWAAMGHSQGGHVALSAAQQAADVGPQGELRAVVAFAPGSDLAATTDAVFARVDALAAAGDIDSAAALQFQLGFLGMLVGLGMEAAEGIAPAPMLGSAVQPLLDVARQDGNCHVAFQQQLGASLRSHLQGGGDVRSFGSVQRDWYRSPGVQPMLDKNAVGRARLSAPVLVVIGTDDTVTPIEVTRTLVQTLRGTGTAVTDLEVAGGDHNSVVDNQMVDALRFLRAQF